MISFREYSDELFKEQNKILEEQIANIQLAKDDALLTKYNLEAIVQFMKEKFANLEQPISYPI